jgi:basic amino acid/polyamine antiporter, APA family
MLERSVSLRQAVIYGVGVILGAGIYALIGASAGISGNALWASFIIAAIIASLTAFSYMELSSKFSKASAESFFIMNAFNKKFISFFIGFLAICSAIFSASTVAWGFATYFKLFFPILPILVAFGVIIICAIINFIGIQESVKLNNLFTFIEAFGLILIIIFGIGYVGSVDLTIGINGETGLALIPALLSSAALIFFAFIGFENIANIAEEVKNPQKNVPKAIILALVFSTIIYVLVAIVSVSVVSPANLVAASNVDNALLQGPLALVADVAIMPGFGVWLSLIALFATFNTALILLIVASRLLYGLSEQKLLPKVLSVCHSKTNTPYFAIIFVTIISMLFVVLGKLEVLGSLTTMCTFLMFFMVNVALIKIRFNEKKLVKSIIMSPINVGRMPILALVGAIFCLAMFLTQYWSPITVLGITLPQIIFGIILFALSVPIFYFFNKEKFF